MVKAKILTLVDEVLKTIINGEGQTDGKESKGAMLHCNWEMTTEIDML